jgi:ParB/RepB/Spo0J family partition protein
MSPRRSPTTSDTPSDAVPVAERLERLALSLVLPSKTNPRTYFNEAYIAELAASILSKGLVQPILVRELENNKGAIVYEIVAGECRYRASKLAVLPDILAVVREYTDEQVLELQLIENIHRRDLSPLEQAHGYRALIDQNPTKHSAESIASRIGMSPAWVWDRLKLNDLVPEAKRILERELMTVGHAILIARLKPADQERVIKPGARNGYPGQRAEGLWEFQGGRSLLEDDEKKPAGPYDDLKPVSIRELEDWIRDHIRFDVAHAAKAQPLDFENTALQVASAEARPGRGKKVIPITYSYRVADDARDENERTYGSESWKRADGELKSKICDHSVLGLVVAGERQGDSFHVCVARDKCLVHFGDVVRAKQKAARLREQGKTKAATRTERRAERREEDRHAKEQREHERQGKAWQAVSAEAAKRIREHLKGVKLGVELVNNVLTMTGFYFELSTPKEIERAFGVALKPATAALVLALSSISLNDRSDFATTTKRWKFDMKPVDALLSAQLAPSGDTSKSKTKGKAA